MSSLEKRHTGQRESMQGHRKYSDGPRDTSSSGSFMDDTDREVSNLTDRAFRSLCIGEKAIYNDSEFSSSPTERHKAFSKETQQKTISHEALSYSIQRYGEAEAQSEMASTFQHSYVDVTHQEQAFREGNLSHMNNGSKEVTWQQSRSTSRVSSLIKAFSSGECYHDSGTCDVILARDRYRDFGSESWDKSAMLSIQSDLSAGYHQNFKSGPFQSYRNHFYTSDVAATVAQMETTGLMKSLKSKFKALNSTNSFFHSEFSPFQLWEEYNRFSFQSTHVSRFMPPREFPRWYDSPMYKELKDNHRIPNSPCESRGFNQRKILNVVASQCSMSTVVQKTSAIEKRCESEMASNYPPWKKNNNLVRNKLPCNRPSTVSPTNERTCRPDSNLFRNNKVTHEIVVESNLPSSVTPFNITQLLTPVIHTRQETETSEIMQFAQTPYASDYSSQGETDPNLQTDVKHLRDSYKFKASSLLFNLKDNRKRVKSTYSPTRFKGIEITDQNKLISKLEGRESQYSDILVSQETAQENLIGNDAQASCNLIQEPSAAPITPKDYTDGFGSYDNLTLTSTQIQDRVTNYKLFCGSSEGHSPSTDPLSNIEISTRYLSAQDKSSLMSEGQLKDLNTFIPARTKIANVLPRAYPPTHSLPAQTSERYGQSDNASQNDLKQRKDFGRKTFIEHSQNEAVKEKCSWDQIGSVKETDSRSESQPFRGEIAALIEMDKQRKATAKQYFANDSYSVRKETYMQKVNEDIKLGRLTKKEEKEVRDETISPRKTSYSEKAIHNNQLSTFSKPIESYGIPKNCLQTKTSPLTEVYGGLQSFSVKNDFVKGVPVQNSSFNTMVTQNTFDQRAHDFNKGQKNEGLYSYQPYRYEPNKQWHMSSTSEDRHTKERVWTQKQSEMIEQTDAKNYKISSTSSKIMSKQGG
ncbi:cardiac-enriched FHL2-interacting protein [Carassius carassius]|uniref:cardiac-enriched FHL2-interacting protein n=1 Tax=Carassius carassius TaxID=217509 RepID=UPI002869524A|nr:cardiac-enriched FHL2-interacting protein [Carassius carassius]